VVLYHPKVGVRSTEATRALWSCQRMNEAWTTVQKNHRRHFWRSLRMAARGREPPTLKPSGRASIRLHPSRSASSDFWYQTRLLFAPADMIFLTYAASDLQKSVAYGANARRLSQKMHRGSRSALPRCCIRLI